MARKYLVRLLTVAALLGLTGQLLAQSTTMTERQGSRHVSSGVVAESSSTFLVGVTKDNGATYVGNINLSDTMQIRADIRPEPANVGQIGDIFAVDRVVDANGAHISFSMLDQTGVWIPWDGFVSRLVPAIDDTTLQASIPLTVYTGPAGVTGHHRIFTGYRAPDGILRYHTSGLQLTISAAPTVTPLQEATTYFNTKINPGVVPYCLDCHVSGGMAQGLSLHTFVHGSTSIALETNFSQMRALFSARGKAYILAKVRGEGGHVGGQILPAFSQEYKDLESFLDLLGKL